MALLSNPHQKYAYDWNDPREMFKSQPPAVHDVTTSDLGKDVFRIPIDRLLALWTARFGNGWVNMEVIAADEFFMLAYHRLKSLGELENHYLTDRARYVCRVPE